MYYVVKSKYLRNFLNALGFLNMSDEDKFEPDKEVYLFIKSDELMEAITWYSQFKKKMKNQVISMV